jgi:hypothetical protein
MPTPPILSRFSSPNPLAGELRPTLSLLHQEDAMGGTGLALLIGLTILVGLVYLRDPLRAWRRYRGQHLVTCPETGAAAAVSVDVGRAAFTSLVEGVPDLRLAHCSRWPERGRCAEPCVCEVAAHGQSGTVAAIVADWCQSKPCVYCGKRIASPGSSERPAALLGPDAISVTWRSVAAERLPALFPTHQPICWSCHHLETFLREHKELVTDRSNR